MGVARRKPLLYRLRSSIPSFGSWKNFFEKSWGNPMWPLLSCKSYLWERSAGGHRFSPVLFPRSLSFLIASWILWQIAIKNWAERGPRQLRSDFIPRRFFPLALSFHFSLSTTTNAKGKKILRGKRKSDRTWPFFIFGFATLWLVYIFCHTGSDQPERSES